MKRVVVAAAAVALTIAVIVAPAVIGSADEREAAGPVGFAGTSLSFSDAKKFKNCTALNKKYPHGVGKPGARDKVKGSTQPVTDFTTSKSLYSANKKSDRDKDGVACEKL